MHREYTLWLLLSPIGRVLKASQYRNLLLLVIAVQLNSTLVLSRLSLCLLLVITSGSCYRRLQRVLGAEGRWPQTALRTAWARAVLRVFAPGRGRLPVLLDWTFHEQRVKTLWAMIPVGGRAVPIAFWLVAYVSGGKGTIRAVEDRALRELRRMLPRRRPIVIVGDRGFRGKERMRLLTELGFHYLLRAKADVKVWVDGEKRLLSEMTPKIGERVEYESIGYGSHQPVVCQLVACRLSLPRPKPVESNKKVLSGKMRQDAVWFLVSDLPLSVDLAGVYALRMQVEETFRDFKSLFGLERERVQEPLSRLPLLLWAMMIGVAMDLLMSRETTPQAPKRLPRNRKMGARKKAVRYPASSATREGFHHLLVFLFLGGSPLSDMLLETNALSQRWQNRPQVKDRKRDTPALRSRHRTQCVSP